MELITHQPAATVTAHAVIASSISAFWTIWRKRSKPSHMEVSWKPRELPSAISFAKSHTCVEYEFENRHHVMSRLLSIIMNITVGGMYSLQVGHSILYNVSVLAYLAMCIISCRSFLLGWGLVGNVCVYVCWSRSQYTQYLLLAF
jgi:hypothetical protein